MKTRWFGLLASFAAASAGAADFYVSTSGDDNAAGTEKAPFRTLAAAVDAAETAIAGGEAGATVHLASGTYNSTRPVVVSKPVVILGTGPANVNLHNTQGDNGGDNDNRVVILDNPGAVLSGVTVSGGWTRNWDGRGETSVYRDLCGACAAVWAGTVTNCVIADGRQSGWYCYAGGIYLNGSQSLLTHSVVRDCGIYNDDPSWGTYNRAGGVYLAGARMENCLVRNCGANAVNSDGISGGVRMESGATMVNCTVANCSASSRGCGGILLADSGSSAVNCAVYNCKANGAIVPFTGSGSRVNCAADVAVSGGEGGVVITAASFADVANNDFTPGFESVLIDAGAAGATAATLDLAGATRIKGGAIDIGAYEADTDIPITVTVVESAYGAVALSETEFYAGRDLTVTATPSSGYIFYRWDGDVPAEYATQASFTFAPTTNVRLVPRFIPDGAEPVVYVATTGDDANSGFSPDAPKASVRAAVAELAGTFGYGDVVVAPGSYSESDVIVVKDPIRITAMGATPEETVLMNGKSRSNEYDARNIVLDNPGASVANLVLQGGGVQNWGGLVSAYGDARGGCATVFAGTISNCVVRGGHQDNWWSYAGGVYLWGDDALLTHTVVSNCWCTSDDADWSSAKAGGVWIEKGRAENCLIAYNRIYDPHKGDGAGGLRVANGSAANCTVAGNTAQHAAGIYAGSGATVVNCAIGANTSNDGGNASWRGTAAAFVNCSTPGADAINATCLATGDSELFLDAAAGGFSPCPGSPLIDAGVASGATAAAVDLAGNDRVQGGAIDIGAYEAADEIKVTITVQAGNFGTATGAGEYTAGSAVTLEAIPDEGYVFDRWEGDVPAEFLSQQKFTFYPQLFYTVRPYFAPVGTTPVQYVSTEGDDANDGFTREAPRRTIVSAVARLAETYGYGDVYLEPGSYPTAAPIEVEYPVMLHGLGRKPADVVVRNTTKTYGPANKGAVLYIANARAGLDNLTVAEGVLTDWGDFGTRYKAGGVHIAAGCVTNCVIRDNLIMGHNSWAGGVYLGGADALLTHSVVQSNRISCDKTDWWIGNMGAGVFIAGGARVVDCLIKGNTAEANCSDWNGKTAGGVLVENGTLLNCTVVGNAAHGAGGVNAPGGQVVNTVVFGNSVHAPDEQTVANDAVFLGSVDRFSHCATDTESALNASCVIVAAADFYDCDGADYRPVRDGALFDAGLDGVNAETADLAGRERRTGRAIDIGCYECQAGPTLVIFR